jgi:hypothetical protein
MDIHAFLLVIVNMALVAAFYAERRGVFDVDDENTLGSLYCPARMDRDVVRRRLASVGRPPALVRSPP